MGDTLTQFMQVSISNQKNTDSSIKNMEVQVGQLAEQLYKHESGSFSTNTKVNPKEQCKVIKTRRGTVVGLKDDGEKKKNEGDVEKNDEKEGVEKQKEQNDEVVINEEVEEKVLSEEENHKLKKQATKKGKLY